MFLPMKLDLNPGFYSVHGVCWQACVSKRTLSITKALSRVTAIEYGARLAILSHLLHSSTHPHSCGRTSELLLLTRVLSSSITPSHLPWTQLMDFTPSLQSLWNVSSQMMKKQASQCKHMLLGNQFLDFLSFFLFPFVYIILLKKVRCVFSDLKPIGFSFTPISFLVLVTFLSSDSIIFQPASNLKTLGH